MKLFLTRHAKAEDTFPDESRKLSDFGKRQIKSLCGHLDSSVFKNVAQIWHSPYERALETAESLKRELPLKAELLEVANITPYDRPAEIARTICSVSTFGGDLILVSHNPFLEELANLLLNAETEAPRINFRTCTMAALRLEACECGEYGTWSADFVIHPKILS